MPDTSSHSGVPPTSVEWCNKFVDTLIELRPHLTAYGGQAANTIASSEYQRHAKISPRAAAQRYHASRPLERAARSA